MTAMTVNDIFSRVQRSFGDEAGVQVTEADIIRWINDAQREAVMQHEGLLMTQTLLNVVAGQQEYDLPTTCFTILHVFYRDSADVNAREVPLRFAPVAELNITSPEWLGASTTGVPWVYTKLSSNLKLRLYPTPANTYSQALKVVHTRYPTLVTSAASPIDLPEYYHSYVEHFCMMKAYEKDEDWPSVDRKAQLIQSTLNENLYRESWFGRETYPVVIDNE